MSKQGFYKDVSMKDKKDLVRCFIALELSREAINSIKEVQNIIKKKNLFYGKFTEPENLHLTLKFLGEIDEKKIEEVRERLENVKKEEFEAYIDGIGVFSQKFLRVLWVKLNGKGVLFLQEKIDKVLEGLFEKEDRFMSHITIARIKKVVDKKIFLDYIKKMKLKKIKFRVKDFVLKKSELTRHGPNYEDIERYGLM